MVQVPHSEETTVQANNIEIVYDTFGEPSAPPMLLIMGLGGQMIQWDDEFCQQIAVKGYWVIRFDNRDVGLSTKFDEAGVPNPLASMQALTQGESIDAPYSILDMANDAIGLLDALKIEKAHIVGLSMGGMIAQILAIHYPERVQTLTSIMSTTGNLELPPPEPEAMAVLTTRPPSDRAEYIDDSVKTWSILQGHNFPIDEEYIRERAGRAFDRSYYPPGTGRQLAAIMSTESRIEGLKNLKVPTLVIHGDADPLVPVEGGIDTTGTVPEAELMIIEGMGHSIPLELAPKIISSICRHAV